MSASRVVRRATTMVLAASVLASFAPMALTTASASTDRLRINFDADAPAGTALLAGATIADVSGQGNTGHVVTQYGGTVAVVANAPGVAADFPGKCAKEPCPNSMIDVPDNASLDPLLADFQWGARILLKSSETADGENIIQKGRYGEAGGQWKLQVDKSPGIPSCVVSGKVPGKTNEKQVILHASISIANGVWHQVTCRRTAASGIQIIIDGVLRGTAAMPVVLLDSVADVTIGAKDVDGSDNDQFQGVMDDAFMTVLNDTPVPNSPPVAAFTSSCVDFGCAFDASTSTDNGPITYAWDFGDGFTDTVVNPAHTFATLGDHIVTLTVTDGAGLTNTLVQTITLAQNTPPTAAFTSSCIDLSCTFDASTSTDNGPLTYAWDFGDGFTDTVVNPAHTFAAVGDHVVTLTVTDGGALANTLQQIVNIPDNVAPVAAFISSCTKLVCTFDASSSTDSGPITYAWTFGDNTSGTGVLASHTYTAGGSVPVVLTVTDAFGATATAQGAANPVAPAPAITFVGQTTISASTINQTANVPATVKAGDLLLMFFSNGTNPTVKAPTGVTGWVQMDALTNANGATRVWRKVATAADAGAQVKIALSIAAKANITIVAYRGTSTTNPVATFSRTLITTSSANRVTPTANVAVSSMVVSYWMHHDSSTTTLTPPAGVTVRANGTQSGGGHVTVLTADSGTAVPVGTYGGLTAKAAAASGLGTAWTIVLAPA
ncbi:MAG: domain containing protein [Ilumatobacteraceae bacterium]|nr:domain containing protein [Ilumatobacteraceae bacterium]